MSAANYGWSRASLTYWSKWTRVLDREDDALEDYGKPKWTQPDTVPHHSACGATAQAVTAR